jgi:cysteine synthase/rhodanese-related sulfurtransferase
MDHSLRVYETMLELLSNAENPTPIVRLNRVVPFKHARVYAKLEWYNPFGAVKDRVAFNLIRDAEEKRTLGETRQLVEPTSGNTGMGLAMIANAKGYKLTATLSSAIPAEKRAVLRLFGADLVELNDDLCPAPGAPEGAMALATEMGQRPGWHQLNQYKNPANPDAHYRTTGPEIWRQTDGKVTHFVAGLGTCGTITGTGRFLKEKNPGVKVLGVHPMEGHDIPGVRSIRQLKLTDFFKPDEYDGLVEVNNEEAFKLAQRLNQEESIIAGPSSGMALSGALKKIPDEPGVIAVVIFPDNVFKYTSSFRKHAPELFPGAKSAGSGAPQGAVAEILNAMVPLAANSPDAITVEQAKEIVEAGATTVIDVRTKPEFDEERIENAVNFPLDDIVAGTAMLPPDLGTPIVTVCNVGEKSLYAMLLLKAQGYREVKNVIGGMNAWIADGQPTVGVYS